jgi:hypothetical protein
MATEKDFTIVELSSLSWPTDLRLPSARFRLFVAADVTSVAAESIAGFAHSALANGMVYFCAWGPGCERFHDLVDEVVAADDPCRRQSPDNKGQDTIMTTWHDDETLGEALDFFISCSLPTAGFEPGSNHWVAISTNPEWVVTIHQRLMETLK